MKALLLLVVILAGVWLWRSRSAPPTPPKSNTKPDATKPLEMVKCSRCGIHIPGNEVVTGTQGAYCSQDHLHQSES